MNLTETKGYRERSFMKKNLVKIILIILLSVTIIPSCKINLIGQTKYKVGILIPEVSNVKISKMAYSAAQRCEELTDQIEYKIYTSKDVESMITQLDKLLQWKADLIVVYSKWTEMQNPIKRAIEKGVVVVNFETELEIEGVYQVLRDKSVKTFKESNYKVGDNEAALILEDTYSKLSRKSIYDTINKTDPNTKIIITETPNKKDISNSYKFVKKTKPINRNELYTMDETIRTEDISTIIETNSNELEVIKLKTLSKETLNIINENKKIDNQTSQFSKSLIIAAIDMGLSVLKKEEVPPIKIIPTNIKDITNN